jgi:AcrR family transcriptional regulator
MPRSRRSAAQTREAILQIAASHLMERGPAEVRLDAIASELGVSRQAVLHHFASRERLMQAVVERAWLRLFRELSALVGSGGQPAGALVDHVDEVARAGGNARLGAWLLLSDQGLPDELFQGALAGLSDQLVTGPNVDARHRLLLVGAAIFGDALFGGRLRQVLGLPDDEADRARLRAELVALLDTRA